MLTTLLMFTLITTKHLAIYVVLALLSIIVTVPTLLIGIAGETHLLFNSYLSYDSVTISVLLVSSIVALWLVTTWQDYQPTDGRAINNEWLALIILLLIGVLGLSASNSNLSLFVGVELQSLVLYIILASPTAAGSLNSNILSKVSLSYLINAATASTFLLYGIATSSALLTLVAVLWKVGIVPVHVWSLPILDNLHSITTSLYLTLSKYGLLVSIGLLASTSQSLFTVLALIGLLNLTVGNVLGLLQYRYQRIITYSSLVQIGYMLLVLAASSSLALSYFEVYSFYTVVLLLLWTVPSYNLYSAATNLPRVQLWIMVVVLYTVAGLPYMPLFWTKLSILLDVNGINLTIALVSTLLSSLIYVRLIKYLSFFSR